MAKTEEEMNKKRVLAIVAIIAIVALMAVCLCACNAESITKKLEKKGYTCAALEDEEKDSTIAWSVSAAKGVLGDWVEVAKFNKLADAKDAQADAEKATGEVGGYKVVCKRVGSVVFYGTEQGVKDAM